MTRRLYATLLRLHPPAFRRRFATEMLWIFDEARLSEGAFGLLFDLLISLTRQWLFRSGVWKAALALVLGAIQVTMGGFGWFLFNPRITANQSGTPMTPIMDDLMRITLSKAHRFLKGDAPSFGRRDEARIANKEDLVLVDPFFPDALQFAGNKG
jgi:hypothetical protein